MIWMISRKSPTDTIKRVGALAAIATSARTAAIVRMRVSLDRWLNTGRKARMITHPAGPCGASLCLPYFYACPNRRSGIDSAFFLDQCDRSGVDEISLLTPCGTSDILMDLVDEDSTLRCFDAKRSEYLDDFAGCGIILSEHLFFPKDRSAPTERSSFNRASHPDFFTVNGRLGESKTGTAGEFLRLCPFAFWCMDVFIS